MLLTEYKATLYAKSGSAPLANSTVLVIDVNPFVEGFPRNRLYSTISAEDMSLFRAFSAHAALNFRYSSLDEKNVVFAFSMMIGFINPPLNS